MKILFAAPDRDLLLGFQRLLAFSDHTVTTAFDGLQVISHTAKERFDVAVLDQSIPRVDSGRLVKLLAESDVPVILLSAKPASARLLQESALANSYLSYPFLPEELCEKIREVTEKARSNRRFTAGDVPVDVPKFLFSGTIRVTNEEINVLEGLVFDRELPIRQIGTYVHSLNKKFALANAKIRVEYSADAGYRLVTNHE